MIHISLLLFIFFFGYDLKSFFQFPQKPSKGDEYRFDDSLNKLNIMSAFRKFIIFNYKLETSRNPFSPARRVRYRSQRNGIGRVTNVL